MSESSFILVEFRVRCAILLSWIIYFQRGVEIMNSKEKVNLHCVEICPVDVNIKVLTILALQSVKFTHRI